MQVYADKLSNGEDKKERFREGNLPSGDGNPVSKADSQIIAERIIKDMTGRLNNICNSGIQISEFEPASGINKDKDKSIRENKNFVFNIIDESGKKISLEISLKDSEFLIKNL
jgi:hypothetical protein